jgi:oligoendopeptidase F
MTIKLRNLLKAEDTWNLSALYRSEKDWKDHLEKTLKTINNILQYRGKLGESPKQLKDALSCYLETLRALEKLYTYSHLTSDEDTTNSYNLGNLQQITKAFSEFSSASSFISPEILEIDAEIFKDLIDNPELAQYKRLLEEINRFRPHTLSQQEENLLALGSEVFSSSAKIFNQLENADFDFGTIEVKGEKKVLSHSSYIIFLRNEDRTIRELAHSQFYKVFDQHKYCLTETLTSSVKKDVYLSRVRNHGSALERGLFGDEVSTSVYKNLITTVAAGLPPLHKYYALRKEKLGLTEQRLFDTHVSLIPNTKAKHSYEEAVEEIVTSLAPLGGEYIETLKSGLTTQRWVDRYENKGKRSGAYSSGCYDSPPYILMNYQEDNINDMFTLAHEAGHSMHSYFSNKNQSYQDHQYTIFVAEVASTFNEQLLFHHLREKHKNDENMLRYLTNQQIDELKGTFYRQTMFAEFELKIHDLEEKGIPLTLDTYRPLYRSLLEKYFGPSVTISDIDELEFTRIPHFYSAFYVYKYATGIAAAVALAKKVLNKEKNATTDYLNFLKCGGSKAPLSLLKEAGIDMNEEEPILATVELMDKLIEDLKATT